MSSYRAGKVSVTNGSKTVTGTGTAFNTNGVYPGDIFSLVGSDGTPTGKLYEVASVGNDTTIYLLQNYQGTTATAQNYVIMNMAGNQTTPRFATRLTEFLAEIQGLTQGVSETSKPGGIPKAGQNSKISTDWLPVFGAASGSVAGTKGLVPAPTAGSERFLSSLGTWIRDSKLVSYEAANMFGPVLGVTSTLNLDTLFENKITYISQNVSNIVGYPLELLGGGVAFFFCFVSGTSNAPCIQLLLKQRRVLCRLGDTTSGYGEWKDLHYGVFAPRPQYLSPSGDLSSAVVGSWQMIFKNNTPPITDSYSIPSGGSYVAYLIRTVDSGSGETISGVLSGVYAGGTTLLNDVANTRRIYGFIWKIA